MGYVEDRHNGVTKNRNKYVQVKRMNNTIWEEPLEFDKGLLALRDHHKLEPSRPLKYTIADIEWFLICGMDSFLRYNAQVM